MKKVMKKTPNLMKTKKTTKRSINEKPTNPMGMLKMKSKELSTV